MASYPTATGARATFAFTLTNPGRPASDGDGAYTYPDAAPLIAGTVIGGLRLAPAGDVETHQAGTVVARATHVVTLPYLPGVTTAIVVGWVDRHGQAHRADVVGVSNPDGRDLELELAVVEATP